MDSDMLASDGANKGENYWASASFFPSRIERFGMRYWTYLLSASVIALIGLGVYGAEAEHMPVNLSTATVIFHDPYISSLLVALFLSAMAYSAWEKSFRATFGDAATLGFIENNKLALEEFKALSKSCEAYAYSRYRYLFIAAFVFFTLVVTYHDINAVLSNYRGHWTDFYLASVALCLPLISYATGAAAWSLLVGARWIALLSKDHLLRIQFGHSDECCGLMPIGNCCLKSTIPLIIGMLLCLIWSNSNHVIFFRTYAHEWREIIVPAADFMMLALFALACCFVFLPIWPLHKRMQELKAQQDTQHSRSLGVELGKIAVALNSNDEDAVKLISERMALLEMLDPIKLKLSSWPFDRNGLIKYSAAPIGSLIVSFGKAMVTHVLG